MVLVSESFLVSRVVAVGSKVSASAGFVQISSISLPSGISPCFSTARGFLKSLLRTTVKAILFTRADKNSLVVAE